MAKDYQSSITGNAGTEVAWTAGDEFYKHIYHLLREEFRARSLINEFGDDHVPVSVALENWLEVLETLYNFTIDFFNREQHEDANERMKELFNSIEKITKNESFRDVLTKEQTLLIKGYVRELSALMMRQCARHGLLLPKRQQLDVDNIW
jgi:hypothetical protein